jgi:hypothetical protein
MLVSSKARKEREREREQPKKTGHYFVQRVYHEQTSYLASGMFSLVARRQRGRASAITTNTES